MAFKEVLDTPAISLGGVNKKTNKANPKSLEGYYMGTRQVPDAKKKTGFGYVHDFQTKEGRTAVWGKTDFDRKVMVVAIGTMVRVTHTGKTRPTPNGDMQLYTVEEDSSNVLDIAGPQADESEQYQSAGAEPEFSDDESESGLDDEEQAPDEQPVQRPKAPARPAQAPNADRQRRVQELLGKNKRIA